MGALNGKVAIITGAASGIGLAAAHRLLAEGASVVAVDLPASDLEQNFASVSSAVTVLADVTGDDAPDRIVARAVEAWGGVDILFNNAGAAPTAPLKDTDTSLLRQIMELNVEAMLRLSQAAVPEMRKRGGGRIINTGSITSHFAVPDCAAYGISKHAVAALTKSMCIEYGADNITANYICPGAIVTGITRETFAENPAFRDFWEAKAPLGRLGQPDDIAGVVAFLASDDARFISGHGLVVDGGASQKL